MPVSFMNRSFLRTHPSTSMAFIWNQFGVIFWRWYQTSRTGDIVRNCRIFWNHKWGCFDTAWWRSDCFALRFYGLWSSWLIFLRRCPSWRLLMLTMNCNNWYLKLRLFKDNNDTGIWVTKINVPTLPFLFPLLQVFEANFLSSMCLLIPAKLLIVRNLKLHFQEPLLSEYQT